MEAKCKKVETLKVQLKTQPGSLCKIYSAFLEANVNIQASWAYEMGPGQAEAIFYPTDMSKAKTVLTQMGFKPSTAWACYAEGTDKIGTYAEILNKISKANINLSATDAFSINGKFATMFFVEDKDVTGLCKALGC